LTVRRADTVVEIPSGGSLAMAGMIQDETKHAITELMVIVTPQIVHAVPRNKLSLPDDGYADSPDPSTVLLGRLNRLYGGPGDINPPGPYRGTFGFIID
jgi:pilus assembly protein CpaC